jgi:hypothetical protein
MTQSSLLPPATADTRGYPLHWSDIQTFNGCRRKWDYASHMRKGLQSTRLYAPFFAGSAVHHAMEMLRAQGLHFSEGLEEYRAKQTAKILAHGGELFESEETLMDDQLFLANQMLSHHQLWTRRYKGPFNDREIEFISHEKPFRVPLLNFDGNQVIAADGQPVWLEGRIDGLLRHLPTNEIWLYELKTARSVDERIQLLPNDGQATMYSIGAELVYGEPVAGVVYEIMRKSVPRDPDILNSGMISKNTRIDTSFEHYLQFVRKHHGAKATPEWIKANYGSFLQTLREKNKDRYFARVPVRRSRAEQDRFRAELILLAEEMTSPDVRITAAPSWGCKFCAFQQPCLARNQNGISIQGLNHPLEDEEVMLEAYYQKRDMHEAYWDALEAEETYA